MVPNQVNEVLLSEFWNREAKKKRKSEIKKTVEEERRKYRERSTWRQRDVKTHPQRCSWTSGSDNTTQQSHWRGPQPSYACTLPSTPRGLLRAPALSSFPPSLDVTWVRHINWKKLFHLKTLAFSQGTCIRFSALPLLHCVGLAQLFPSLGLQLLLAKEREGPDGSPRISRIPVPGSNSPWVGVENFLGNFHFKKENSIRCLFSNFSVCQNHLGSFFETSFLSL